MRHFKVLEENEIPLNVMPFFRRFQAIRAEGLYPSIEPVVIDVDLNGSGSLDIVDVLGQNLDKTTELEYRRVSSLDIQDSPIRSGTLLFVPEIIPASRRESERKMAAYLRSLRDSFFMNEQMLLNFGSAGLLAGALVALYEATGQWAISGDYMIRTDAEVEVGREKATLVLGCDAVKGIYCDTWTTDADEFGRVGIFFTAFFPRCRTY